VLPASLDYEDVRPAWTDIAGGEIAVTHEPTHVAVIDRTVLL